MLFEERHGEHYVSLYVKRKLKQNVVNAISLNMFISSIKLWREKITETTAVLQQQNLCNLEETVVLHCEPHSQKEEILVSIENEMSSREGVPLPQTLPSTEATVCKLETASCDEREALLLKCQSGVCWPNCCPTLPLGTSEKDCLGPAPGLLNKRRSDLMLALRTTVVSLYMYLLFSIMCLYKSCITRMSILDLNYYYYKNEIKNCLKEDNKKRNFMGVDRRTLKKIEMPNKTRSVLLWSKCWLLVMSMIISISPSYGFTNEFDKVETFLDKVNLEQSIAAVFNKVAYGGTTKRSIPENAYPTTTLATPPLTTYRFTDGNNEWLSVDVKKPEAPRPGVVDYDRPDDTGKRDESYDTNYGIDLEKDHGLPTPASNADILRNNNNKNYENPNRYNNDRLRPDFNGNPEQVTENVYKTTTSYNSRNVRPTKSIYSKDIPSYVPPSRAFFTPPLPPEYLNPFADKPTLRGTSTDGFANRRPIPPPSLMPNKDRIPFRPDLPPSKAVNAERPMDVRPPLPVDLRNDTDSKNDRKKTLNTPSQNINLDRIGEYYGLNRNLSETTFEYEKVNIPSITRILSGSNGRPDDISDILLRTVTSTPFVRQEPKITKPKPQENTQKGSGPKMQDPEPKLATKKDDFPLVDSSIARTENVAVIKKEIVQDTRPFHNSERSESVTVRKDVSDKPHNSHGQNRKNEEPITQDSVNMPNIKEKDGNVTKASSDDIWLICWNVHIYLVVFCFVVLALYSIFKLIRYENDPHMFSKSYFLTIHLMLTIICVLRIFYLAYDPYNFNKSFNIFLYDFLHNFPLSLLATTFAVLILFLLKRTLTHLKVKTRPVFLVSFGVIHIFLCFCLSISETLGHFDRASLIICKPVFVLLAWALGASYLYLYKIIKNVLAKKSQNLSEMCTQNISYASHITIAVALLFVLLGFVQLYALFFIEEDRFNGKIKHHWILWGFELSVRVLEISIITLLAIVVSLKMSQREKQTVGFPLFPCTTSDSSTDNIYPTNCNTNPNAVNYSRNEMIMDTLPTEAVDRPNLIKNSFQNDSFDKKSTLERYQRDGDNNFGPFERPKWGSDRFDKTSERSNRFDKGSDRFDKGSDRFDKGSDRFDKGSDRFEKTSDRSDQFDTRSDRLDTRSDRFDRQNLDQTSLNNFSQPNSGHFERNTHQNSSRTERTSARKTYDTAKYYTKPKYDLEFNNEDYQHDGFVEHNVYSEPVDQNHQYERTRHEFERSDMERRSRNSTNTSGRRSTGRARKNHARPHLGIQTLPNHDHRQHQIPETMLVDDQGFVRFRHMQEVEHNEKPKRIKKQNSDMNHYSDA